jgi:mRNA export factor
MSIDAKTERQAEPFWKLPSSPGIINKTEPDTIVNPNEDIALIGSPADMITSLSWNKSNWIAASSWAKQIRVWAMTDMKTGVNVPKFTIMHATPVLKTLWNDTSFYSGTLDGQIIATHINSASVTSSLIYQHVSSVTSLNLLNSNTIVSGSWDHTLKLYDLRSANVVHTQFLSDQVFCVDVKEHLIVVATADREISTWDSRKMGKSMFGITEDQSLQIRSVALLGDLSGYVQGSLNGRCSVVYYDNPDIDIPGKNRNYRFRCHSVNYDDSMEELFAVNAIDLHPGEPDTFATAGSDGRFSVWNVKTRMHVASLTERVNMPLTAFKWSPDGNSAIYAAGNDFARGTTSPFSKIFWHPFESANNSGSQK